MKQEDINKILVEICEIANIIDENYIQYVSAILLISYTSEKNRINEWNMHDIINNRKMADFLDSMLKKILSDYYAEYGIFKNFSFYKNNIITNQELTDSLLKDIVIKLKRLYEILKNDEQKNSKIATGYEEILNYYIQNVNKVEHGELCTPKEVSQLLSILTIRENTKNIYDPMCGTGSFLIEAAKNIDNEDLILKGVEDGYWKYNLVVVNLILHEVVNFEIFQEKQQVYYRREKFDAIITNPPFVGRNSDKKLSLNNNYSDYDFIFNVLENLKEDGVLSIILPQGAVFRKKDKDKRQYLVEQNLIDAVIQLPENIFLGAKNSVVILIIRRNREHNRILFINASKEFEKQKKCNVLNNENIKKIEQLYKQYKNVNNLSYVAEYQEIQDKEFDLSVQKYVKDAIMKNKENIDLQYIYKNIIEEQNKIIEIEKKLVEKIQD